jgi:hypothetical protein
MPRGWFWAVLAGFGVACGLFAVAISAVALMGFRPF